MRNPCSQCIVTGMCKKPCNDFLTFLNTNLKSQYRSYYGYLGEHAISAIARAIKEGHVHLYDSETRWGTSPDGKYKESM